VHLVVAFTSTAPGACTRWSGTSCGLGCALADLPLEGTARGTSARRAPPAQRRQRFRLGSMSGRLLIPAPVSGTIAPWGVRRRWLDRVLISGRPWSGWRRTCFAGVAGTTTTAFTP